MSDDGSEAYEIAASTELRDKAAQHLDFSDESLERVEAAAEAFKAAYEGDRKAAAAGVTDAVAALLRGGPEAGMALERLVLAFERAAETATAYGDDATAAIARSYLDARGTISSSRAAVFVANLHADMVAQALEEDWQSLDDPRAGTGLADLKAAVEKAKAAT